MTMGKLDRFAGQMRTLNLRPYCGRRTIVGGTTTTTTRLLATTTSTKIPFYGQPRPETKYRPVRNRIALALHSATTAFSDPARADAVAALGEVTGSVSLGRIRQTMMNDPTGRLILQDRPVVSKATIPYETLMANAPLSMDHIEDDGSNSNFTFGQAYGAFLKGHGFDPDERDAVRYIDDEELAYVMLRYRQCHDFWHVLTGLPPTVVGELGIKWLELFQTGLPIAALSSTVGSLRLDSQERALLFEHYLPWAIRTSQNATCCLMNVYYEKEFDTPLNNLRERLQLEPAPKIL